MCTKLPTACSAWQRVCWHAGLQHHQVYQQLPLRLPALQQTYTRARHTEFCLSVFLSTHTCNLLLLQRSGPLLLPHQAHKYMVDLGVTPDNIFHLDLSGSDESRAALQAALQGCQALVICTAAVPEVALLSTLLGGLWFWAGSTLAGLLGRQQQPPGAQAL